MKPRKPPQLERDPVTGRLIARSSAQGSSNGGLLYEKGFVSAESRAETLTWLKTLKPLWEKRYSPNNPPPQGQPNRSLLRPVYWLGNWQFACLDYYHPPKGLLHRCVRAETFPPPLARWVEAIERKVHERFAERDIPKGWTLNTCLINFYGSHIDPETGRRTDVARVGEHKDFEPGPVASISFGERALFQFVRSSQIGSREGVVLQQWLEDSALQVFGGRKWKEELFHRVQRVERGAETLGPPIDGFETRRINFTFRFVPEAHWCRLKDLPPEKAADVAPYVRQLAEGSEHFRRELEAWESQD
jgi:alkylated DNA repair protein (DNA oxidative demethylase)